LQGWGEAATVSTVSLPAGRVQPCEATFEGKPLNPDISQWDEREWRFWRQKG